MKKILAAALCITFAVSSSFAFGIIPKVGVDIPSTMNYEKGSDDETKRGFTVGVEARNNISGFLGWGAGIEYVLPRGLNDVHGDTDFSFLPIYVSLLFYPFGSWDKAKPYLKGSVGYSVLADTEADADFEGKLYWSAALGAEYKNFVGEVVMASYDGEIDNMAFSYQKIGFTLGYKFNINIRKSNSEQED